METIGTGDENADLARHVHDLQTWAGGDEQHAGSRPMSAQSLTWLLNWVNA